MIISYIIGLFKKEEKTIIVEEVYKITKGINKFLGGKNNNCINIAFIVILSNFIFNYYKKSYRKEGIELFFNDIRKRVEDLESLENSKNDI